MSLLSQLHAMLGSQLCFKSWTKHTRIRCLGAYGAYTEPLETGKHLESLKSEQSSMGFYGIYWPSMGFYGVKDGTLWLWLTVRHGFSMALIEIDGLLFLKMVDLSMANC